MPRRRASECAPYFEQADRAARVAEQRKADFHASASAVAFDRVVGHERCHGLNIDFDVHQGSSVANDANAAHPEAPHAHETISNEQLNTARPIGR